MKVSDLMTKGPMTTPSDVLVIHAMEQMEAIHVLPVIEGEKVVGLLRMHDVVQAGLGKK